MRLRAQFSLRTLAIVVTLACACFSAWEAVLIGPIVAEVLLGFRCKAQGDWVASRLRAAHFFEATWDDWKSAAEIGRELAAKGHAIPITDLIVAAVAKRTGCGCFH